MIHVLGCGRVVGSRQGVQGSPENEDLVTRQFLENIFEMHFFLGNIILTWHDGPRTCW